MTCVKNADTLCCFLVVHGTAESHFCHFKIALAPGNKTLNWLCVMNYVLSGSHLLSNPLRCLYLYQLCQVSQLYFMVAITQQKAAKSSWNVVIRWMGVLWECRHLRRSESSIKGLRMMTTEQTHTAVMTTQTDLRDDSAVLSELRLECWKWGEFDELTIFLWAQHCIIECSRFLTGEGEIQFLLHQS